MIKLKDLLLEMPQYYPGKDGNVTYQKDRNFLRISKNNISRYKKIYKDNDFLYMIGPAGGYGMVFLRTDMENPPPEGLLPVMTVSLRDSGINEYKQAHTLRIREQFASRSIASTWYIKYVEHMGGIVSDFEHLEGGKSLWRSLIDNADMRGMKVSLVNINTGKSTNVDGKYTDDEIWSKNKDKINLVLVLENLKNSKVERVIDDYIFNDNEGDLDLSGFKLTVLPKSLYDTTIKGNFDCSDNLLTSLQNSPVVSGNFDCSNNKLTSLIDGPSAVDGDFDCSDNKLTSLAKAPKNVNGDFYCENNTSQFTENQVRFISNVRGNVYT